MQSGAAEAIHVPESAYGEVVFMDDRTAMDAQADVVLCVQPPALEVVDAMKPGAILIANSAMNVVRNKLSFMNDLAYD